MRVPLLAAAMLVCAGCTKETPTPTKAEKPAKPPPEKPKPPPPPTPSAPTRPPADRAGIEAGIEKLSKWVEAGASDPKNPWAMAHGLHCFGADHKVADGRLMIDVMVDDYAEQSDFEGKKLWGFPSSAGGEPVEPHRNLIIKSLLEAKVPLSRKFELKSGETITLQRLVDDARTRARLPEVAKDWHHFPWTLGALIEAEPKKTKNLGEMIEKTMAYTESEQAAISALMDQQRPDLVKKNKQGIYAHTCGGLHLVQAAVLGAAYVGGDELKKRAIRQLETVLFRHEAERTIYAKVRAAQPQYRRLILVQELKFYGHVLETLVHAHQAGFVLEGKQAQIRVVMEDLLATIEALAPDYAQLEEVKKQRKQSYLDMIGDGCHAVRGLRESLVAFFRGP